MEKLTIRLSENLCYETVIVILGLKNKCHESYSESRI